MSVLAWAPGRSRWRRRLLRAVVAVGDEVELQEAFVECPVDRAGVIPVEGVERVAGTDGSGSGASGKVAGVTLTPLERDELLAELHGSEASLGGLLEERTQADRPSRLRARCLRLRSSVSRSPTPAPSCASLCSIVSPVRGSGTTFAPRSK